MIIVPDGLLNYTNGNKCNTNVSVVEMVDLEESVKSLLDDLQNHDMIP